MMEEIELQLTDESLKELLELEKQLKLITADEEYRKEYEKMKGKELKAYFG